MLCAFAVQDKLYFRHLGGSSSRGAAYAARPRSQVSKHVVGVGEVCGWGGGIPPRFAPLGPHMMLPLTVSRLRCASELDTPPLHTPTHMSKAQVKAQDKAQVKAQVKAPTHTRTTTHLLLLVPPSSLTGPPTHTRPTPPHPTTVPPTRLSHPCMS